MFPTHHTILVKITRPYPRKTYHNYYFSVSSSVWAYVGVKSAYVKCHDFRSFHPLPSATSSSAKEKAERSCITIVCSDLMCKQSKNLNRNLMDSYANVKPNVVIFIRNQRPQFGISNGVKAPWLGCGSRSDLKTCSRFNRSFIWHSFEILIYCYRDFSASQKETRIS